MLKTLTNDIIHGRRLNKSDDLSPLLSTPISDLCSAADQIREHFCSNQGELCTIINGRSGKCSENCKFCAQSSHFHTDSDSYDFLTPEDILKDAKKLEQKKVHRYSIVTAGRTLDQKSLHDALACYQKLHAETSLKLCASHGLLTADSFIALKESGVTRYHCNLETSRKHFPSVCTTHTYDDKLRCIRAAKEAGLEICSGGILGIGESLEDRIDMAFDLAALKVDSIPLNILIPIPGTPFAHLSTLSEEEILRSVGIFRFICPESVIRLAAGRGLMTNYGAFALKGGANAVITGDMLTTSGSNIESDRKLFQSLHYII